MHSAGLCGATGWASAPPGGSARTCLGLYCVLGVVLSLADSWGRVKMEGKLQALGLES